MPVLHNEGKIGRNVLSSVAALEEAELLCTVVSDTGTGYDYSASSTAATYLPRWLKSARQSQVLHIRQCLTVLCSLTARE
jgi:hypothetical protein